MHLITLVNCQEHGQYSLHRWMSHWLDEDYLTRACMWAWEQQILTLSHIHHFCQLIRSRRKRAIHLYRFCLPDSRIFLCLKKKYADLPANLKQRQDKTQGASLLCSLSQQCSLLWADSCSWLEMWMPAWCPRNPALLPWSLGTGSWQTFMQVGWE